MSVIVFLQFKSGCDAGGICEGAAMWLFKQYLTGTNDAAVKSCVALPNSVNTRHEGALRTYFEAVLFLLIRYATDHKTANLENKVLALRQGNLTPTVFAQQLWSRTVTCRSVCDEKSLKAMLVEGIHASIRKTLRLW